MFRVDLSLIFRGLELVIRDQRSKVLGFRAEGLLWYGRRRPGTVARESNTASNAKHKNHHWVVSISDRAVILVRARTRK